MKRMIGAVLLVVLILVASGQSLPLGGWKFVSYGNNDAVSLVVGNDHFRTEVVNYVDGDAKWFFTPVPVKGNYRYEFSDAYRSNTRTKNVVLAETSRGKEYINAGVANRSDNWFDFRAVFLTPMDTINVTVYHLIDSNGWLEVKDEKLIEAGPAALSEGIVSLDFDADSGVDALDIFNRMATALNGTGYKATVNVIFDELGSGGYPSLADVASLKGFVVGSHSATHRHLWQLPFKGVVGEISQSRLYLTANGIDAKVFAYPYGEYDAAIEDVVKNAGYIGARTSNEGFNFKGVDPYQLYVHSVKSQTTMAQIHGWIDYAKKNNLWLILLFYKVDGTGEYSISTEVLQDTLDYIKESNIRVVTTADGIALAA